MQEQDLISIIVPVYNMERYLERCMESILGQTYQNLEIILVDDGSSDASPKLCDDYAARDARVQVIHKHNGGLSDARNAGLAKASGTYIGYVDSDDWIEPNMYEEMYQACIKENAEVAICRYSQVYQDREVTGGSGKVVGLSQEELLRIYIGGHEEYVIYNSVWSKLFRRDVVELALFPTGHNSEDIMYTTKAFCKLKRAVYLDTCFYHYVLDRSGSIMNMQRGQRMFRDEIPFWKEHIAYISEQVSEQMGMYAAYHFYRRLLFYYMDWKREEHTARKQAGNRTARAGASKVKYSKKIVEILKEDRLLIKKVYQQDFVTKGDKYRMQLMQLSPMGFAAAVEGYEACIVPLKSKRRG